ncbi:hypothetical protein [Nonomuraea sp. NPDC049646]
MAVGSGLGAGLIEPPPHLLVSADLVDAVPQGFRLAAQREGDGIVSRGG